MKQVSRTELIDGKKYKIKFFTGNNFTDFFYVLVKIDEGIHYCIFYENKPSFAARNYNVNYLFGLEKDIYTCNITQSDKVYEAYKLYPNTKLFRKLYPQGIENGNFLEVRDVL